MTTESSVPEAGWYPTPNGEKRYWDGAKWLALPQPDDEVAADRAPEDAADTSLTPNDEQRENFTDLPESDTPKQGNRKRRAWIGIATAVVLVLGLVGGGVAWKSAHDAQVVAEANAAAAVVAKAAAKAEAEKEAAAEEAQQEADDLERADRAAAVDGIEASVKTMAEGHATEGIIDGPIIDASCSPVGGGSMDDLDESTTVFECFVANKDNGDGTMSGYTYNATMNWSTGSYTYSLGAA